MRLARIVRTAFGVDAFFRPGWEQGEWVFVGVAPAPEIAAYAFHTLFRQVQAQRRDYVSGLPKRLKMATKRNRGNLFARAWVSAVAEKVGNFAGKDRTGDIEAYLENHHPELQTLTARDQGLNIRVHDVSALDAGRSAGRNARLDHGINGGTGPVMIEGRG
ncbi:MAG: hypothetical protein VB101_03635, partial [Rhodospirillaceae bacterium]|nr:hypothetical protein [Rhodospirillaceae bacterium]